MKNVLLFIIDSMNQSYIKRNSSLTPFINSLKKNSISFENMYSQAPYTEAAVMNIYCGQNVLDKGGYLKRFENAEKTIFEEFKNNGYETYYNSLQPQCFPSSLKRGIDNYYYNVGYEVNSLWNYRLYLYANLYKQNMLSESDYNLLIEIMDDNFSEWEEFLNLYLNNDPKLEMIYDNSKTFNILKVRKQYFQEKELYNQNKKHYINNILRKRKKHKIFKIDSYFQDKKIKNEKFKFKVKKTFKPFFKNIQSKQKIFNRAEYKKHIKFAFRKIIKDIFCLSISNMKDDAKMMLNTLNLYYDFDLFKRINSTYDSFKNAPSVKTHIDHYIKWETNRDKEKPSFATIHVDDIHNPEVFFTYDTEDIELLKNELLDASDVLNNLSPNYKGNITHDLSLRYIDSKIKYLFNQLQENNLLNNTIIAITADHGFSFAGNPVRNSFVTNMFLENYNIPFILYGYDKKVSVDELCSSKDVISLLLNCVKNIDLENYVSLLKSEIFKEELFIEYCGGGCPDLSKRKIKIACFNKEYFVSALTELNDEIFDHTIDEIYDLKNDPFQLNNLKNKTYNKLLVDELFLKIKKRLRDLYDENVNCKQ